MGWYCAQSWNDWQRIMINIVPWVIAVELVADTEVSVVAIVDVRCVADAVEQSCTPKGIISTVLDHIIHLQCLL